jgi:hypothetical protein
LAKWFQMSFKSRELGTATLGGLIVGGLLSTILSMADLPFSTVIGAFIGGVVAAYVLYGKLGQAATAGALAGILGTPFFLGLSQILAIFDLIPIPPGPTPSLSELQGAVVIIVVMDLVAGAIGGLLLGLVRRPRQLPPPPPAPPGSPATQNRYCVQCGAQMPPGTLICPHCSARQPQ